MTTAISLIHMERKREKTIRLDEVSQKVGKHHRSKPAVVAVTSHELPRRNLAEKIAVGIVLREARGFVLIDRLHDSPRPGSLCSLLDGLPQQHQYPPVEDHVMTHERQEGLRRVAEQFFVGSVIRPMMLFRNHEHAATVGLQPLWFDQYGVCIQD